MSRATLRIEELTVILERQLSAEQRDEERLKHLRQATGQITRSANDGIQAYRRISRALESEASQTDADPAEVADATRTLADARKRMLAALEIASQRYPWAEPWKPAGSE
jgi:septation ring formation regulator EzrA